MSSPASELAYVVPILRVTGCSQYMLVHRIVFIELLLYRRLVLYIVS
jgi:hypothetical protein